MDMVDNRKAPILDFELESFLRSNDLNLTATLKPELGCTGANYVIVATPTNYDTKS